MAKVVAACLQQAEEHTRAENSGGPQSTQECGSVYVGRKCSVDVGRKCLVYVGRWYSVYVGRWCSVYVGRKGSVYVGRCGSVYVWLLLSLVVVHQSHQADSLEKLSKACCARSSAQMHQPQLDFCGQFNTTGWHEHTGGVGAESCNRGGQGGSCRRHSTEFLRLRRARLRFRSAQ